MSDIKSLTQEIIDNNHDVKNLISAQNMMLSNLFSSLHKTYDEKYREGFNDGVKVTNETNRESDDYLAGLYDAWELVQKLYLDERDSFDIDEVIEIFGNSNFYNIFKMDVLDVINLVGEYEVNKEKNKANNKFEIGDEVNNTIANKYGIIKKISDRVCEVISFEGDRVVEYVWVSDFCKKTGRRFNVSN